MSNRYIEASAEDVASSVKVRVVLEEGERRVHLCNLPYRIASGGTTDVVRCDFLADIIVRGIRSLEEEKRLRAFDADCAGNDWRDELVDDPVKMLNVVRRLVPGIDEDAR